MWSHILLGPRPVFLKSFEKLAKTGGDYLPESSDFGRVGSAGERTGVERGFLALGCNQ